MADEITTSMTITLNNGDLRRQWSHTTTVDQSTARANHNVQQVGITEEALSTVDITDVAIVGLLNLDTTNFVMYGTVTGNLGFQLDPGESAVVKLRSIDTLYLQADTAACDVNVMVLDR